MKYILFLFLVTSITRNLLAQDSLARTVDSATILNEVVVTATRNKTFLHTVPYAVVSIGQSAIEKNQYRTTPEMLVDLNGVFIQKTNHAGGSPFVRGLTGNQTLILVDGIRLNNATFRFGPNQYLNTIDPFTVNKVEIVKGSGSVQYGSDALGGVVNILSKDPSFGGKKINGQISTKIVSQDMEYTGRAEMIYSGANTAFSGGVTVRKFGDLYGGGTTGKQSTSGYKEMAYDVKLKHRFAPNMLFTAAYQFFRQQDVPLYHRVKLENFAYYFFDPQQRNFAYLKMNIDKIGKIADQVTFIVSNQQSLEHRSYLRNGNSYRYEEEDKVNTTGITADVYSVFSSGWKSNSGAEFYFDRVKSDKQQIHQTTQVSNRQRGLYPNDATGSNMSLYSLHHLSFKKLNVEAGGRYNFYTIFIPDTGTTSFKEANIRVKPSSLVFNAALAYLLAPTQTIFASFNTGYRMPNIDDMASLGVVDFRYELPAYDLKPEKTYNTEIGFRIKKRRWDLAASIFYMHLSNIITRVQIPGQQINGYQVYSKTNSQQAFIRGAELEGHYQLTEFLRINASGAYAFGNNLSRNEPLRRIPPVNGRIQVLYEKRNWDAFLRYAFAGIQNRLAQGDKDDNRIPVGGTPGWQVADAGIGYKTTGITTRIIVQNIFNEDYRTHGSGINQAGRNIVLTSIIHF